MEDFSGHVINNKNKNHFTKDNSQKVLTPRAHQTKFDVLTFGGVCVCVFHLDMTGRLNTEGEQANISLQQGQPWTSYFHWDKYNR